MKLGIVGSRHFSDDSLFEEALDDLDSMCLHRSLSEVGFVTGDCPTGADAAASNKFLDILVHEADWDKHGRAAGSRRNQKIIDDADELVAFLVGGKICRGTWDSIRKAAKKGIPIHIYTQMKPEEE